jgi:acyl-CoA thioester hydrolase
MSDWPFAHTDEVRFAELDTQGHLNNVSFLVFVESARMAYATSVAREHPELTASASFTFMIVEVKISYRSPGHFTDRIETRLRPSAVGRSSFRLDFEMRVGERLLADGYSVLVTFDPRAGSPIAVPQPLRERLLADGAIQS